MSLTVYAEAMGFFHKGSNGKGVAPLDVCLTPPPPPTGPLPIPYVNMLSSSDLTKGSKTVKIDGEPTALEDASEVSTSTGDEPGTQGGGVVTHKTKGKGSFTLWSFTVKVEGKGVCRHGDMMIQNTASTPPNCICPTAMNRFEAKLPPNVSKMKPCPKYRRKKHAPAITAEQDELVRGKTCWECAKQIKKERKPATPGGRWAPDSVYSKKYRKGKYSNRPKDAMTPDHQPPMSVAWAMGGCHIPTPYEGFRNYFSQADKKVIKAHCRKHANSQGPKAGSYAKLIRSRRS